MNLPKLYQLPMLKKTDEGWRIVDALMPFTGLGRVRAKTLGRYLVEPRGIPLRCGNPLHENLSKLYQADPPTICVLRFSYEPVGSLNPEVTGVYFLPAKKVLLGEKRVWANVKFVSKDVGGQVVEAVQLPRCRSCKKPHAILLSDLVELGNIAFRSATVDVSTFRGELKLHHTEPKKFTSSLSQLAELAKSKGIRRIDLVADGPSNTASPPPPDHSSKPDPQLPGRVVTLRDGSQVLVLTASEWVRSQQGVTPRPRHISGIAARFHEPYGRDCGRTDGDEIDRAGVDHVPTPPPS